jgi:exopolysaccharide production protein ExoZ
MKTVYVVQYLRAFAALAVVVFHASERTGEQFMIGAAGVDIFFVISGFIMVAISDARPMSPGQFFKNRLLRIAPAYWAATTLMIVGAAFGLFPNLTLAPIHMLASYLFIPVASPNGGEMWPVLVQGWTLNYEIFFYAVFAATLFLKPLARFTALAAIFGLLVLAGLTLKPENPLLAFYMAPIILEFVAGAALAKFWRHGLLPSLPTGIALMTIAIAGFATIELLHLDFNAWSCGPLAVMLVLGALTIEARVALPKLPLVAYLGDASYSIYLWHTFAVSVVLKLGASLAIAPATLLATAILMGTVIGILGYECFERPVQSLLKRRRPDLPFVTRETSRRTSRRTS